VCLVRPAHCPRIHCPRAHCQVPDILEKALANAGLSAADVDHLLLHQANIRIIEAVASRLGIPMSKVRYALHTA